MSKILVVDDEPILLKGLKFSLEQEGHMIDTASDGEEAINKCKENNYDLVILDVMLPLVDGMEVCRTIRKTSTLPIIMLTARGDDESIIEGLQAGADDYIPKPFNILELKARINAIFRRTKAQGGETASILKLKDFSINTFGRKVVFSDKTEISLTAKEFDLLLLLVLNEGTVFTREDLLEKIWGYEYFGDVRTVDVHIRRLREKIEKLSSNPEYILTKWGTGYYFKQ